MNTFYCPSLKYSSKIIFIDQKDEVHHLSHVLKQREGQEVYLINGKGTRAQARIEKIQKQAVKFSVISSEKQKQLLPKITLACAIPKKGKFDSIVEKSCELGASFIQPIISKHSDVQVKQEKRKKQQTRLNLIALNATKQSKQFFLPKVHEAVKFSSFIKKCDQSSTLLIASLKNNSKSLLSTLKKHKTATNITILIGPEGDFSDSEYCDAFRENFIPITLGPNILKVETAAFYALSCTNQFYWT